MRGAARRAGPRRVPRSERSRIPSFSMKVGITSMRYAALSAVRPDPGFRSVGGLGRSGSRVVACGRVGIFLDPGRDRSSQGKIDDPAFPVFFPALRRRAKKEESVPVRQRYRVAVPAGLQNIRWALACAPGGSYSLFTETGYPATGAFAGFSRGHAWRGWKGFAMLPPSSALKTQKGASQGRKAGMIPGSRSE